MNIWLIGFMGSGKSYIGQKLAVHLGREFLDLDSFLEQQTGQTIAQIFEQSGEAHFRKIETACLEMVAKRTAVVIATGGGTPCFGQNMQFMNENGNTIFLNVTTELLEIRLRADIAANPTKRPLLTNQADLGFFINKKIKERLFFYEKAKIIIDIKNENTDVIGEILHKLKVAETEGRDA